MPPPPDFPWYNLVRGVSLEQGDLLLGCPHFVIPPEKMRFLSLHYTSS